MAVQTTCSFLRQSGIPLRIDHQFTRQTQHIQHTSLSFSTSTTSTTRRDWIRTLAMERGDPPAAVPNSNYVVPMDSNSPSCITRPLAEILRDLNKRIPDNIITKTDNHLKASTPFIPWYHANRWCGEIRDVMFSDSGSVTVVYRVTVRGADGEAYRESTGTISPGSDNVVDPVAAAEELAFCRACARFGLGLYLYHED